MIQQNVAKKTNNFQDIDREYAYAIWLVEKDFLVGPITDDYLVFGTCLMNITLITIMKRKVIVVLQVFLVLSGEE